MAKKPTRRGHKTSGRANAPAIVNRRAGFDYALSDDIVTGVELTGQEVRAARDGRVNLRGAYVTPKINSGKTELFLINASFSSVTNAPKGSQEQAATVDTRPRKLLAHRREIDRLVVARAGGLTIVPTKLLTQGRFIKVVIALGKGKKRYDKREVIRKKDATRENAKYLKRL